MDKYMKLLGNVYFRRFFLASAVLNVGRKLSWIALGWFVYQVTGSTLAIGIVISAATISPLVSSIFVGGILDQYNRRRVMVLENIVRGTLLALIPIFYWFDILSLWVIVLVVFINGMLSSFTTIGTSAILPEFLEKEELETGNAVFMMTGQFGSLVGPALGGFSTALVGAPITLFMNVMCFMVAALLYYRIPHAAYHKGLEQRNRPIDLKRKWSSFYRDTKEGFQFIFTYKSLVVIALVTFFFNFTYAPLEPMLPVFVNDIINEGAEALGLMWTCFAIGSFIGSLGWIRLNKNIPYSYALGLVIFLWGMVPTSFGFLSNILVIYIMMFLGGVVYAPYNIISPTLKQRLVPNTIRGRVFGVYGLIAGLGFPIGVYVGGYIAEYIGVVNTIIASGIMTMLLGLVVGLHPLLRMNEVNTLHPIREGH
ncbi:MFS transporter [Bacillus spongiae]|uniref:MFS transporter n=1 Tax=Bacillus spongiae TaxID=2683610 RepID=A0ABU8HBG9_9BACI